MTKTEIIEQFKKDYPVLTLGNDENGYRDMTKNEYDEMILSWAENVIAEQLETKLLKDKESKRLAVLEKLGLTTEEAELLLS